MAAQLGMLRWGQRQQHGAMHGSAALLAAIPPIPSLPVVLLDSAPPVPHPAPPHPAPPCCSTMLTVSRTYLGMPVIIHELVLAATAGAQQQQSSGDLVLINQRSRLYLVRVPPDQLNPEGCGGRARLRV